MIYHTYAEYIPEMPFLEWFYSIQTPMKQPSHVLRTTVTVGLKYYFTFVHAFSSSKKSEINEAW